jgi:hypothetical protein
METLETPVPAPHKPPTTKVIRNAEGGYETVPYTPGEENTLNVLAGYVDFAAAGLGVSRTTHTDTFICGPFRFRIRPVGREVLLADDAFVYRAVKELNLEEMAAQYQDFSRLPEPEKALSEAAIAIYVSEAYRVGHPDLSARADELVKERYQQVIRGIDPDGNDPDKWGGLVDWRLEGAPLSKFPFTPDNVRALNLQTQAALYSRLLVLSRSGASDAQFRGTGR